MTPGTHQCRVVGVTFRTHQYRVVGVTLRTHLYRVVGVTLRTHQYRVVGVTLRTHQYRVVGVTLRTHQYRVVGVTLRTHQYWLWVSHSGHISTGWWDSRSGHIRIISAGCCVSRSGRIRQCRAVGVMHLLLLQEHAPPEERQRVPVAVPRGARQTAHPHLPLAQPAVRHHVPRQEDPRQQVRLRGEPFF